MKLLKIISIASYRTAKTLNHNGSNFFPALNRAQDSWSYFLLLIKRFIRTWPKFRQQYIFRFALMWSTLHRTPTHTHIQNTHARARAGEYVCGVNSLVRWLQLLRLALQSEIRTIKRRFTYQCRCPVGDIASEPVVVWNHRGKRWEN